MVFSKVALFLSGFIAFALAIPAGSNGVTAHPHLPQGAAIDFWCRGPDEPVLMFEGGGEPDDGGHGVLLHNADSHEHHFFLYENSKDTRAYKGYEVNGGETVFVKTCATFQGRIVRGTKEVNSDNNVHNLGTWTEFNFYENQIWGDRGFTEDIVADAPENLKRGKDSGASARIPGKEGGEIVAYLDSRVSRDQMYVVDTLQSPPVFGSLNGRFEITFYPGYH